MFQKWLLAFTLLVALALGHDLQAQPSLPDSGRCPWKLPFRMVVQADGKMLQIMKGYDQKDGEYDVKIPPDTDGTLSDGTVSFDVTIDTTNNSAFYRLINDELTYEFSTQKGPATLTIIFARGSDSIILLDYRTDTSGSQYARSSWSQSQGFDLRGLIFNDSEILCSNASLATHQLVIWNTSTETENLLYQNQSVFEEADSIDVSGVFRKTLLTNFQSSVEGHNQDAFEKICVFPNPLSQSATISFTPETSGYANVFIVNLLGAQVAHLFSGEVGAGEQHFTWEPAGLPDGVYECVVRMNGKVETLPVVVAH